MRREVLTDAMRQRTGYDPTHQGHMLAPARIPCEKW